MRDWKELVDEDAPKRDLRVTKNTLVNTLRFSAFRGDITQEYADKKIAELETEKARENTTNSGYFKRTYDYIASFFR